MGLQIGIGREIITPKLGGNLLGYRQDIYSQSVHDDLTATAIAFRYGSTGAILISATVCLIDESIVDELRTILKEKTGVQHVILVATHTHSGPITARLPGWGDVDRPYVDEIFIPGCVKAACQAFSALEPARMGVGTTKSDVGVNRREIVKDGSIILGRNPWGFYDPMMTVIAFQDLKGNPLANIIHYGAHCTAAGANHEITRDWVGVMTDRLEKESGAVSAFVNGALGDVGPRLSNGVSVGDLSHVIEIGSLAALDAVQAYRRIRDYSTTDCDVVTGEIKVPYEPLLPLVEAEEEITKYAKAPAHNIDLAKYLTLKEVIRMHKNGEEGSKEKILKQTLLRVGSVVLVPFPFEIFSEIGLRLRALSPVEHTLTMSCTNGSNGYLPDQSQICRGGYEVEVFHWLNAKRLPNDTDTRMINENLKLLEGLHHS